MKPEIMIWELLHDGFIIEINGNLPNLTLRVNIPYLRKIFSQDGDSILVHLEDCSCFQYSIWDDNDNPTEITDNLHKIQSLKPEILHVKEKEDFVFVECNEGELKLKYKNLHLSLDTGEPIAIPDLHKAAKTYWKNLPKKHSLIFRLINWIKHNFQTKK